MAPETTPPVGRLAPSPTGRLHVGHARSFLLAWWHLRSRGGRVLLRIEDLDAQRCRPEFADTALRDLEWLGLDWDGEPVWQSRDVTAVAAARDALLESGRAYACVCSRSEIREALSAPQSGLTETRYPGTCRGRFASPDEALATGRTPGIRLQVERGPVSYEDAFAGSQRHDVAAEVGDFLIARRDGVFAYQLAVVVFDAHQGVTEVLRGQDLLSSTARQLLLQDALGLPHPPWLHVPLVVDDEGERLAKRRGDLALASFREAGVDPRALVAWVARSAGQTVPERVSAAEVLARFDLTSVPHGPVRFGSEEASALSGARLRPPI